MARRHHISPGDLESLVGRLQELVLANSGEDAFDEIFKLLVARLHAERHPADGPTPGSAEHPESALAAVNHRLAAACARWGPLFEGDPVSRLTADHLAQCVQGLNAVPVGLGDLDVLDAFFQSLVSAVSKGQKGQYFTPRHVIECCVRLVDPAPGDRILDPACGSGGFLVHALNHVRGRIAPDALSAYADDCLWGCDFDRRAVQVARALLIIAGVGTPNIHRINSLLTPSSADGAATIESTCESLFDVVLTNPPFAGEIREPQLLATYELHRADRRMERDVLFLERCVRLLRPGGRLCIVLPDNKFSAANWAYVRQWLIRHVRIVGVVGLDRPTFLPHTHQKTSVLLGVKRQVALAETACEKTVRASDEPIVFVVSESSGKDSSGRVRPRPGAADDESSWRRADHDFEQVVSAFQDAVAQHAIQWSDS